MNKEQLRILYLATADFALPSLQALVEQGYNVVAEFVSSEEILAEIKKFGIKYAQGFLLGKPTSPSNIEE